MVQSLFFTNEFRRVVFNIPITSEDYKNSFVFWLKCIFYALQFDSERLNIHTHKFLKTFKTNTNWDACPKKNHQIGVHEIYIILRQLKEELCKYLEKSNELSLMERLEDLFVGKWSKTFTSARVDGKQEFWDISLEIEAAATTENIEAAFEKLMLMSSNKNLPTTSTR